MIDGNAAENALRPVAQLGYLNALGGSLGTFEWVPLTLISSSMTMANPGDRDLGMDRPIIRRDFLNGVGLALTGSLAYPWFEASRAARRIRPREGPWILPPEQMGSAGGHDGSWEVAHALRDGKTWHTATVDPDEVYDLVVVGGGISGLSAAYFFRKAAGPNARILVLDNHDDFGGHAKRNEFRHADRLLIGYGGTQSIDGPSHYSAVAKALLVELGIDVKKFYKAFDRDLYDSLGLRQGVFFDRETFGVDRLVVEDKTGEGDRDEKARRRAFAAKAPFTEKARHDFLRLHEEAVDYLPGLSADEKRARLKRISYADFLRDYARVDPQVIAYFQQRPHGEAGVGIDAISALESLGFPGFQGMGLTGRRGEPGQQGGRDPYIFHFPDGNASIARLLVHPSSRARNLTMSGLLLNQTRAPKEKKPWRNRDSSHCSSRFRGHGSEQWGPSRRPTSRSPWAQQGGRPISRLRNFAIS